MKKLFLILIIFPTYIFSQTVIYNTFGSGDSYKSNEVYNPSGNTYVGYYFTVGSPGYSNITIETVIRGNNGATGNCNVEIFNNNGSNRPTGSALASGTMSVTNTITIQSTNFSGLSLSAGDYVVVFSEGTADPDIYVNDQNVTGYIESTNAGSTWQDNSGRVAAYRVKGATALPVELTNFTALINGSNVELKWSTATEVNNHGFEVQRSAVSSQKLAWGMVGFVDGYGNSNSPKSYSFTDQPTGGTSFAYRLKQIDNDGKFKYYDAITVKLNAKTKAELMDNYPNPFNPSTAIKFYIPNNSDVSIKIYDVLGKEVTTLINKQTEAGYHIVYWNGRDRFGKSAASGVYIYRLTAGSFIETKKMALLK